MFAMQLGPQRADSGPTTTLKRTPKLAVLATLALVIALAAVPVSAHAHLAPYYDYLAPYGSWSEVRPYGWVWAPRLAAPHWRPYTVGHWEYTDFGWTWFSDEPWGEVVFHYGRWVTIPSLGWVWVPGTLWGPAWVTWRWGVGYFGWAPLPPEAYWVDNYLVCPPSLLPPPTWVFTETRFLGAHHLHRHLLGAGRNHDLVARIRYVGRVIRRGGRHVRNFGPPHHQLASFRGERSRHQPSREAPPAARIDEGRSDFIRRDGRDGGPEVAAPRENRGPESRKTTRERASEQEKHRAVFDSSPDRSRQRRGVEEAVQENASLSILRNLRSRGPLSLTRRPAPPDTGQSPGSAPIGEESRRQGESSPSRWVGQGQAPAGSLHNQVGGRSQRAGRGVPAAGLRSAGRSFPFSRERGQAPLFTSPSGPPSRDPSQPRANAAFSRPGPRQGLAVRSPGARGGMRLRGLP